MSVADLRDALVQVGCTVEARAGGVLFAEHCGQPVSSSAPAGGILGFDRIWCRECGAEVGQGREIDDYVVVAPSPSDGERQR